MEKVPSVTWIFFWIDKDRRPFRGQQHCSSQEGGQQIGFDGHKKTKGSKIHVAVTPQCLPIAIDLGSGNEHESRKLIPLLNDIQIKNNNGRPKSRPERVWADTKYHTFLVLTYLYKRRIGAQIKERRNTKPKQTRQTACLPLPRIQESQKQCRKILWMAQKLQTHPNAV